MQMLPFQTSLSQPGKQRALQLSAKLPLRLPVDPNSAGKAAC